MQQCTAAAKKKGPRQYHRCAPPVLEPQGAPIVEELTPFHFRRKLFAIADLISTPHATFVFRLLSDAAGSMTCCLVLRALWCVIRDITFCLSAHKPRQQQPAVRSLTFSAAASKMWRHPQSSSSINSSSNLFAGCFLCRRACFNLLSTWCKRALFNQSSHLFLKDQLFLLSCADSSTDNAFVARAGRASNTANHLASLSFFESPESASSLFRRSCCIVLTDFQPSCASQRYQLSVHNL